MQSKPYVPRMSPTAVATPDLGYNDSGVPFNPNPRKPTAGVPALSTSTQPFVGDGNVNLTNAATPAQAFAVQPGVSSQTKMEYNQPSVPVYATEEQRKEVLDSLPDIPQDQAYILHKDVRNQSLSTEIGVIHFNAEGYTVVPFNFAMTLSRSHKDELTCRFGSLGKSLSEKAKSSPQFLALEERLKELEEENKKLKEKKVKTSKTSISAKDQKLLKKVKKNEELLSLINSLLSGKKEMVGLFAFLSDLIKQKKYGLAIAIFWKSFEEEFKKPPKSLENILSKNGVSFEEESEGENLTALAET